MFGTAGDNEGWDWNLSLRLFDKTPLLLPFCSQGQNPFESDDFTKNGSHLLDSSFNFDSSPRHGEYGGSITVTWLFILFIQYEHTILARWNKKKNHCSVCADMPSSQPIDIPDAKKRNKKKKRCRATDSFSGRFEGMKLSPLVSFSA